MQTGSLLSPAHKLEKARPERIVVHGELRKDWFLPIVSRIKKVPKAAVIHRNMFKDRNKKAFDLIDHSILVRKLCALSIPPSITNWIIDFLSCRSQRIKTHRRLCIRVEHSSFRRASRDQTRSMVVFNHD